MLFSIVNKFHYLLSGQLEAQQNVVFLSLTNTQWQTKDIWRLDSMPHTGQTQKPGEKPETC
jgi:hypothetical protein